MVVRVKVILVHAVIPLLFTQNAIYFLGENGAVTALLPNHAVSCELLTDLRKWNLEGATLDDAIERLRLRTVPPGYTIHTWMEGICIHGQHHNIVFFF